MSKYFIGLMSGSSLDGIDAVVVDFSDENPHLLAHICYAIPDELKHELDSLTRPAQNELARSCQVDAQFGELLADAVNELLKVSQLKNHQIRAIGSHGHTIRHYPQNRYPTTLQIGDPNRIAQRTSITTVSDFRRRDMAAGGQGAPLVPAFHHAVFSTDNETRIIVNIGGIANLTFLPEKNSQTPVSGFDTGPGNALLDAWIEQQQQKRYDRNGQWAASGSIDEALLSQLKQDEFFHLPAPKSTGRDYFNLNWLGNFIQHTKLAGEDVQATLTELTATTIADAITSSRHNARQLLICGGGYHNSYLIQRLQQALDGYQIDSTMHMGVDPDWVEAMAFAWLASRTLAHQPGNIPAVTGAKHEVILGAIYPG